MNKPRVAVVGAGISGLTCAYELQKAGASVIVFEARAQVGGRMATRTKQDLSFDIGADHLCNLYTDIQGYAKEFQLTFEPMRFLRYGLFKQGKIVSLTSAVSFSSRLKLLWSQRGARRIASIFDLSKAAPFDTEDADTYGRAQLGDDGADYLVDSFVSTYQFHRAKEISSGVFVAILESLRYDHTKWNLHQLRGGMSVLPDAFAKHLTIATNTPVKMVTPSSDGVIVSTKDGSETYDAVVLACTANVSASLLQEPTKAQKDLLASTKYSSTMSVAFRIPKSLLPPQSVVWVPFAESQKISGYTNQMMKGNSFETREDSLLCTWLHEDYAKTLLDKSDDRIFDEVKKELLRVCPSVKNGDLVKGYDLERWTEAMPKFAPGHLRRVKTFLDDHQGENNIFLCGDYMNSLWTEGSVRGGKRTAQHIMERFSSTS